MEDKPLWIPALVWQRWSITLYCSIVRLRLARQRGNVFSNDAGSITGFAIIHMTMTFKKNALIFWTYLRNTNEKKKKNCRKLIKRMIQTRIFLWDDCTTFVKCLLLFFFCYFVESILKENDPHVDYCLATLSLVSLYQKKIMYQSTESPNSGKNGWYNI